MLTPARHLTQAPDTTSDHWSTRRLNYLWSRMRACSTYLEIGVQRGHTFQDIGVAFKWGVDPAPLFNTEHLPAGVRFTRLESDAFFADLDPRVTFDLAFLDGLHTWSQTYRDLLNTLRHSHPSTLILIDDVVPSDQFSALPDEAEALKTRADAGLSGLEWHGDVYKVLLAVGQAHPELDFRVIDDASGNSQAILWQRADASPTNWTEPDPEVVAYIDQVAYAQVFIDGSAPASFRLSPEVPALDEALRATGHNPPFTAV